MTDDISQYTPRSGELLTGQSKRVNVVPGSMTGGFDYTLTASAAQVTALDIPCSFLWVQPATGASGVKIGGDGDCIIDVYAGLPLQVPIDNANKLYALGSGTLHVIPFR